MPISPDARFRVSGASNAPFEPTPDERTGTEGDEPALASTGPEAGVTILLDYSPRAARDGELAEDLQQRLFERGYLLVSDPNPPESALQVLPVAAAAIRIVSPSALSLGFSFRRFDPDLPVFTIGIDDGSAQSQPFAAEVVWDPSLELESADGAGWGSRNFVLQAAMDFVAKVAPARKVREEGPAAEAEPEAEEEGSETDGATAGPEAPLLLAPIHDPTPLHLDTPAADDRLGRRGLARTLAVRLERIWREMNPAEKAKPDPERHAPQGSFVVHLHGEWGSGKSSLLEMLRRELRPARDEREPAVATPWVVIDFNAWQNQRLDPPWWPLLDGIHRQSLRQLSWGRTAWCWLRERLWRFTTKRRDLMIFAVLILLCGLLGYRFLRPALIAQIAKGVGEAGDAASHLADIAALLALFGGWLWLGSRSLVSGSARAAQSFVQSVADPMDRIERHFAKMVRAVDRPRASAEVRAVVTHLGPDDPLTLDDVRELAGLAAKPA